MADDEKSDLQEVLAELMNARPTKAGYTDASGYFDDFSYSAAINEWVDGYNSLNTALKGQDNFEAGLFEMPDGTLVPLDELDETELDAVNKYNGQLYSQAMAKFGLEQFDRQRQSVADENDRRSDEFRNKVEETRLSLGYDEAELNRAAQDLDRWLAGQDVAGKDADRIADARKQAGLYGTSGGKRSFTANELGAGVGALARQGGVSGDVPFLTYPGTQMLDPVGDRLASMEGMGISNAPPAIPAMGTLRSSLPTSPELLSLPSGGGGVMPTAPPMLMMPDGSTQSQGMSPPLGDYDPTITDAVSQSAGLPPWKPQMGKLQW